MSTLVSDLPRSGAARPDMAPPSRLFALIFGIVLAIGLAYVGTQLAADLEQVRGSSAFPFLLLGLSLLIALGFEFVNGFHDTANAVATVIYTHSMPAQLAVVWSGIWNLIGVLLSSGLVAFGIISLLPVELILQVGSAAGFAMVFALLVAAIVWNLGTWYLGLPNSSSHTLIGSIIGVGLMNQLMASGRPGTSGVDWGQALTVGEALLFSPVIGFAASALLLVALKLLVRKPELYTEPKTSAPPPLWIRSLLVLTCTAVSFAHGSNDGQKGMGLIMLILIGTVPTAYALNHAVDESRTPAFVAASQAAIAAVEQAAPSRATAPADPRAEVTRFIGQRELAPATLPALATLMRGIEEDVRTYGALARVPTDLVANVRNDMYLADEALRLMKKQGEPAFSAGAAQALAGYKQELDDATKFIPTWVKVAVALALGMGTMVGWKRIVVTVGEKIGKQHLTYGQGACAELVAAGTIGLADIYGLPVSTTHVLSSGVAGTMAANGSGLQWATIRNLISAWLLTLPASILLSGALFWLFARLFA
ncbi:MAG: inorganic phosphate transporter [Geminicoccaceae bacterium]